MKMKSRNSNNIVRINSENRVEKGGLEGRKEGRKIGSMQTRDNKCKIFTLAFYLTKVNLCLSSRERTNNMTIRDHPTYTQKGVHYLVRVSSLSNQNGWCGEPSIVRNRLLILALEDPPRTGSLSAMINSTSWKSRFRNVEMQLWRFFSFFLS